MTCPQLQPLRRGKCTIFCHDRARLMTVDCVSLMIKESSPAAKYNALFRRFKLQWKFQAFGRVDRDATQRDYSSENLAQCVHGSGHARLQSSFALRVLRWYGCQSIFDCNHGVWPLTQRNKRFTFSGKSLVPSRFEVDACLQKSPSSFSEISSCSPAHREPHFLRFQLIGEHHFCYCRKQPRLDPEILRVCRDRWIP